MTKSLLVVLVIWFFVTLDKMKGAVGIQFFQYFFSSKDMITVKKEPLDQDILEMENKTLKHGLATLQKTLNDMENKMTEQKAEMQQKENELSRVCF